VSLDDVRPVIAAHDRAITTALPALAAELDGLAEGAGISREEAVLLQIRRELMGYRTLRPTGDCTTYARSEPSAGGPAVLAQTVDLSGNLDDNIAVLDFSGVSGGRSLLLSFAGLLGYLGLNSAGLAVGLNLVLGGRWRPGVPPYLAIRHVLDLANSVDEAIEVLATMSLASSRSFMLCDETKAAWVETLEDRQRVHVGPRLVHTNHYLHPDLTAHDRINPFARRSSLRRLDAGERRLTMLSPSAEAADHFGALGAEPIRVPDLGDIRRERTVATVVMFPGRRELHLKPGGSRSAVAQCFALPA
jgi:hypothetical protein